MTSKHITIQVKRKEIPYQDPFQLYKKLTDKGNNISLLMESRSINLKYGRQSILVPNPAIRISGKDQDFKLVALTPAGEKILSLFSEEDFDYSTDYRQTRQLITGTVEKQSDNNISESDRFKLKNISYVIKTILAKFPIDDSFAALYGAFAYDFARNFYNIADNHKKDGTDDFVLFLPTNVYAFDDIKEKAELLEFSINGAHDPLDIHTKGFTFTRQEPKVETDFKEDDYKDAVQDIIKDIKNGRAMQCVLSRQVKVSIQEHPIESYSSLRKDNPSPYSFFYNLGYDEILYGASPEMHIVIDKKVDIEIRPIAGTIRRSPNPLDDAKARIHLLTDEKELREHVMLIDLARHELYSLSHPDSVYASDIFTLEEYPNLYHLVSGVKGKLKKGIDAVDSLLITLPAGTLSGSPKLEAMKMVEQYERSRRGFYGGAIGYLSFNGNCNTGITIRSVHVKDNKSILRAGGGIVALSTPEGELAESILKMEKSLMITGGNR